MQTMKVALAVLCVAALLVVGECIKTKAKKSSSKSLVQWKKEDPSDPKYMKLLKWVLKDATCPNTVPCKQVDAILKVNQTSDIIIQNYDMDYFASEGFNLYECDIKFRTDDLEYYKEIQDLKCWLDESAKKSGKV